MQLYDFDPLRVRKEYCDRRNQAAIQSRFRGSLDEDAHPYDGDRDGIELVTSETVIERCEPLTGAIITGSKLPYMMVTRPNNADVLLIDGERIISVQVSNRAGRLASANPTGRVDFDFPTEGTSRSVRVLGIGLCCTTKSAADYCISFPIRIYSLGGWSP